MDTKNLITTMDYCRVVSSKKLKGSGLQLGDCVLVTGTRVVPATNKDLYLQRVLAVAVIVKDGEVCLPSESNEYKAYLVDPRSLEKMSEEETTCLKEKLQQQYQNQK